MDCTCPFVYFGMTNSGSKNWNPDCPEHGGYSEWYNSPEQIKIRLGFSQRLTALQREAARLREEIRKEKGNEQH